MASLARQAGPNQEQSFCETSAVVPDTLGISPDNSFGDQQQQFIVYNFQTASSFTVAHLSVLSTDIQEIVSQDCYEACTPASSNIIQGDDPNNIPFIPFSDDPKFNIRDHLLEHQGLEWQNEGNDPDLMTVILETARRLHCDWGIPITHIDETEILPRSLCTILGAWGSIWIGTQNDPLKWPGSSQPSFSHLPDLPIPDIGDLRIRLQDYLTLFCPNLNCIQASCLSHNLRQVRLDFRDGRFQQTRSQREDSAAKAACGDECYMNDADSYSRNISWSAVDREILRTTLHLSPQSDPCDLAVICRKPCREVFVLCQSLALNRLNGEHSIKGASRSDPSAEYVDDNPLAFTPNEPCDHNGPCSADSQCPCYLNKAHCARSCRCISECPRRWKGCSVDVCRNSQIQKGLFKDVEVKRSDFGLGLFLKQTAKEGDLIAEYVGELIYEATFDTRGQLSTHRGRSYVYGMNASLSNDSTYVGNEARFINHAPQGKANCTVNICLVNGDHRIGVYARKPISAAYTLYRIRYSLDFAQ
ncbi:hypothetical protein AcV7_001749 [Taiwanofungus camphoratus]|nr:hypothetical protein AcV7_001749 [Antrodia cinnamomea]